MNQWIAAFQRYAIAAAAATVDGQYGAPIWRFDSSMAHMDVVLKIATGARNTQRPQWLGMIYDRIARKSWAERAAANEVSARMIGLCISHFHLS